MLAYEPSMNLEEMISELGVERELVEEAILALERYARTRRHRAGWPSNWRAEVKSELRVLKRNSEPRKERRRTVA